MTKQTESRLLEDVAKIKQALMGNGVKGLAQRMREIEEWRHTHPRQCPLESPINPRRVNGWFIFFGIMGVLGVVGSLAVAILK